MSSESQQAGTPCTETNNALAVKSTPLSLLGLPWPGDPATAQWPVQGAQPGPLLSPWVKRAQSSGHPLTLQPMWPVPSRHSWLQPNWVACPCPVPPCPVFSSPGHAPPLNALVCISSCLPSTSPTSRAPSLRGFSDSPSTEPARELRSLCHPLCSSPQSP